MYNPMKIALRRLGWQHTVTDSGEEWQIPGQANKITFDKGESLEDQNVVLTATLQEIYNVGKEVVDHLLANLHFYNSKDYMTNLLTAKFGFFFYGAYCHLTEVMAFLNFLPAGEKNTRIEFLVWMNVFGSRVLLKRDSFLIANNDANSFRWFGANSLYDWAKGRLVADIVTSADLEMEKDQPKWKQGYVNLYNRTFHLNLCNNEIFRSLHLQKDFADYVILSSKNEALKDTVRLIQKVIIAEDPPESEEAW